MVVVSSWVDDIVVDVSADSPLVVVVAVVVDRVSLAVDVVAASSSVAAVDVVTLMAVAVVSS